MKPARPSVRRSAARRSRSGTVLVFTVFMMIVMMAFLAFAVDVGYISVQKAELQAGADAAVLACAMEMYADPSAAKNLAVTYAELNGVGDGEVLDPADVVYGTWNPGTRVFSPNCYDYDAVRVTLRRSQNHGNAIPLFFARAFGIDTAEAVASAVAYSPNPKFRFLIDEEMIDSDEPAIEALAQQYGIEDSEDLITDNDGDGYIDLPVGVVLDLPTGQVGDEAMFDVTTYGTFPFGPEELYSTIDFLAEGTALESSLGTTHLQDLEWPNGTEPHPDLEGCKVLDNVVGVDPVSDHDVIMALPGIVEGQTFVSPVFKSDVGMQETDPSKYGSPTANLQGERRGLMAYKIHAAWLNPSGGSYLPMLTIEIVDGPNVGGMGSGGKPRLVQ